MASAVHFYICCYLVYAVSGSIDLPACGLFAKSIPADDLPETLATTELPTNESTTSSALPESRILNGELASSGRFPWAACLQRQLWRFKKDYAVNPKTGQLISPLTRKPPNQIRPFPREHVFNPEEDAIPEQSRATPKLKWDQFCSASVVGARFLLTSGHCFLDIPNGITIIVNVGSLDCALPGPFVDYFVVEKRADSEDLNKFGTNIFAPPMYWERTQGKNLRFAHLKPGRSYDLSLIKLDVPLNLPNSIEAYNPKRFKINSICLFLVAYEYPCGDELTAIGYGMNGDINESKLRYLNNKILANPDRNERNVGNIRPDVNLYGAVNLEWTTFADGSKVLKNQSACPGDSGGAHVKYVEVTEFPVKHPAVEVSQRALQVGINTAAACLSAFKKVSPSINDYYYTADNFISLKSFLLWIQEVISQRSDDALVAPPQTDRVNIESDHPFGDHFLWPPRDKSSEQQTGE